MKINYKKMNTGLDIFYTLGLSTLFVIAGLFINNIAFSVVSIGYLCWICFLWIRDIVNKVQSKSKSSTENQTCDEDNKPSAISTVCPV